MCLSFSIFCVSSIESTAGGASVDSYNVSVSGGWTGELSHVYGECISLGKIVLYFEFRLQAVSPCGSSGRVPFHKNSIKL